MGDNPPLMLILVKIIHLTMRYKQDSAIKNLVTTVILVSVSLVIFLTHASCISLPRKATQAETEYSTITVAPEPIQADQRQPASPRETLPSPLATKTSTGFPSQPLLFARADDLYRADVAGDAVEQLTVDGSLSWGMEVADDYWRINALSLPPRISPDGRRIAFSPDGATIMVVDVLSSPADPISVSGSAVFAWSPDSRRLAYAVHEGSEEYAQLIVRDFDNDAVLSLPTDLVSNISALAWSPDGRYIAFSCCFEQDYSEAGEYQGTSTGQLWTIDPVSKKTEAVGLLWRSVAGGIQPFCWTEQGRVRPVEDTNEITAHCSIPPDNNVSPSGLRRFYVSVAPQADSAAVIVYQLVVENMMSGEIWRRDLPVDIRPVAWTPDEAFILLDDNGAHTPIWRLGADGADGLEIIIEDGYLLGGVESWN